MLKNIQKVIRAFFSLHHMAFLLSAYAHRLFDSVLWRLKIHAGKDIRIHPTASIRNPHNVYMGDNSHINLNCCVWAGKTSKIVIGKNLLMGPCVQLHASRHGMALGEPMTFQPLKYQDITIGDDVWLCAGSIVTTGVFIANGVVVAANAVVTKNIDEENVIVGGIPARVIGRRKLGTYRPRASEKGKGDFS